MPGNSVVCMVLDGGWIAWLAKTLHYLISAYGLAGYFLASIIANASIFFGVPFDAIVVVLGATNAFHTIVLGLIGGFGAAFGELTAYALGFGSIKIAESFRHQQIVLLDWVKQQINQKGMLAVFLLLLIPFPFDLVGIAAGLVKMDIRRFFLATFLGKTVRYSVLAYLAAIGAKLLLAYFGLPV